jgi:hypothetical protein
LLLVCFSDRVSLWLCPSWPQTVILPSPPPADTFFFLQQAFISDTDFLLWPHIPISCFITIRAYCVLWPGLDCCLTLGPQTPSIRQDPICPFPLQPCLLGFSQPKSCFWSISEKKNGQVCTFCVSGTMDKDKTSDLKFIP